MTDNASMHHYWLQVECQQHALFNLMLESLASTTTYTYSHNALKHYRQFFQLQQLVFQLVTDSCQCHTLVFGCSPHDIRLLLTIQRYTGAVSNFWRRSYHWPPDIISSTFHDHWPPDIISSTFHDHWPPDIISSTFRDQSHFLSLFMA